MTASIADLLERASAEACAIPPAAGDSQRLGEQLAGWPALAAAAVRVLKSLPIFPTAADTGLAASLAVLNPVAQPELPWRAKRVRYTADSHVHNMAKAYGAIADLLARESGIVLSQPDAVEQLRRAVLGPLAVAADATLAGWTDDGQRLTQRWHLHWIRAIGEAHALNTPAGSLGTVAATQPAEPSLDGAIRDWAELCRDALLRRHSVSRLTFEIAARGMVLLTASTAVVLQAARDQNILRYDPNPAIAALTQTNSLWRTCAVWPAHVHLGGVPAPDLRDAARRLRTTLDETVRSGNGWADPGEIFRRTPPDQLLGTLQRGLRAGTGVAAAHYNGLNDLVRGRGQLWIAAKAINERTMNLGPSGDARHHNIVPMPRTQPEGPSMLWMAEEAAIASDTATRAVDAVVYGQPAIAGSRLSANGRAVTDPLRPQAGPRRSYSIGL